MKMKLNGNVVEDDVSITGMLDCKLSHEIKETKGSMIYNGPKIPPEMWRQVLSYFKWCYDTYKSECQVRLYVSPTNNTWRAWAFPQEAKTGMTARELDNEDAKTQRAELDMNPPDWIYFGTVHHHCAASAFQSGTDADNEKNQDGLHITIGKMDEKKHDIHVRFYRKGLKFTPDMSWFYDVEPELELVKQWMAESPVTLAANLSPTLFLGHATKDDLAKSLMCEPSSVEFPQAWRENIVEIKVVVPYTTPYTHPIPIGGTHQSSYTPSTYSPEGEPSWRRAQRAWKEILHKCVERDIEADDVMEAVTDLALTDFAYNIVAMACRHHRVDPDDIEREMPANVEHAMVEEAFAQQADKHVSPKTNTSTNPNEGKEKANGEAPPSGTDDFYGSDWSHLAGI
jgi:hypothetical protein